MANNPSEATNDDFLEQILGLPSFASAEAGLTGADGGLGGSGTGPPPMMLQLSSGDLGGGGGGSGGFHGQVFPLGLSLEQGKGGFLKPEEASGSGKRFRDDVVDGRASSMKNVSWKLFLYSLFGWLESDGIWRKMIVFFTKKKKVILKLSQFSSLFSKDSGWKF